MDSMSMKRALYILYAVVLAGFALVFVFLWRSGGDNLGNEAVISSDQVGLRQTADKIQYRISDGPWQDIIAINQLAGRDGVDGEDGTNGQDGVDGQKGADGAAGAAGVQGATGAKGADGKDGIDGANSREIELQKDLYSIQWRYVGEAGWRNLIAYSELKGEKGDTGERGAQGPQGPSLWGGISGSIGDQSDLSAALGSKVGLTGNQTVAGTKTFSSAVIAPSGTSIGGVLYLTGTGFPEGVVSAPVGSKYIDTAMTNGAQEWMKKSGTGNTGWVVTVGDTGWRDILSELPSGATGVLRIRRYNNVVQIAGNNLDTTNAVAPNFTLLPGFRVESTTHTFRFNANSPTIYSIVGGAVIVSQVNYPGSWHSTWLVSSAWPPVLPGVAA